MFALDEVTLGEDATTTDGPPPVGCVIEDFTGGFDTDLFVVEQPTSTVAVVAENDRLVIRPQPNVTGSNALLTKTRRDLTGGYVQSKLLKPLSSVAGDVELKITADTTSSNYFMIYVNGTNIGFRRESETSVREEKLDPPYSTTDHAYWRIAFPSTTEVEFLTSASGVDGTWTSQQLKSVDSPITQLLVALVGVTFSGGIPANDEALYDDLTICPHGWQSRL